VYGRGHSTRDESKFNRCTGVNIVLSASTDRSVYGSEVAGIFGIATMIGEIRTFHHITAGTVFIGRDSLSTLVDCTDVDYVIKSTSSHFDLITATRAMLQQCLVKWIPRHILEYEDDDPDAFLDRRETLNIELDNRAKVHWARHC
jgi:hypothetical protein